MNINDVQPADVIPKDILSAIFNAQRALMNKYEEIEKANGLLQTDDIPVDLHDRFGQARLKDFAWRTVEELAEALDALCEKNQDHFLEELADGLHFITEMSILSGITPQDIIDEPLSEWFMMMQTATIPLLKLEGKSVDYLLRHIIMDLGMACNQLKNKPWKSTHVLTDIQAYKDWFTSAYKNYLLLFAYVDVDAEGMFQLYFRKNKVNQFRQESNY